MSHAESMVNIQSSVEPLKRAIVDLSGQDFSFWSSDTWMFNHTNPANPHVNIGWKFSLPGGGWSTDRAHVVLLESFKSVIWGMLVNADYGKPMSVGTLPSIAGGVRELFRWAVWRGVADFSQMTLKFIRDYCEVLPQLIVAREEVYPGFVAEGYDSGYHASSKNKCIYPRHPLEFYGLEEDDSLETDSVNKIVRSSRRESIIKHESNDTAEHSSVANVDEDDGISYSQVSNRISVLFFIKAQRKLLKDRGLPFLGDNPFGRKSVGELSAEIARYVINRIPALPQSVSLPILNEVLKWVDEIGGSLAAIHRSFHTIRDDCGEDFEQVFSELDALGLSSKRFANLPWRERIEGRDIGSDDPCESGRHRLRLATLLYRDACVLAIQYLAGLRISEVCSVMVHKAKVDGLPSCIYKRSSPDGMLDLYFLKSKIVKGHSTPKDRDWVIGCVSAGSPQIPIVVRALNHLHDVVAPFLSLDKQSPLFLHYSNTWGMPKKNSGPVRASGVSLQRGCRRFIRCFVDLSHLPDYDDFGNDLRRYRDTRGGCIRTHQGRKTFADFCLKTRKSSLNALSFHFGHLNETITYKGYYEPVQRLASEVESMAHTATVDFMVGKSENKVVFGNMAEAVNSFLADHKLDSIDDVKLLRSRVTEIVLAHDIRIFFSDFGNCFVSVAPMKSRCNLAAGGASWQMRAPDYATRSISMCAGCDCFALDASHMPYWIERERQWRMAASDPANRVAVTRHAQSLAVIAVLNKRSIS